ncbi:class I adenylate-forming enzyme family protein [Dictyobacter kobayashii]|uniref:Acetyl-CoA synthetase n=1 Tax=Dictyobacter kobayashii TaxID=2014872 RepID=A0A402ASM6_9CHLR|nr:class I adenylate-forming enzyme family protein [Dictyobacter kobayashii]GCE22091.1 acetyl-CoA synthetase [Dictyobacter kobayashii]
MQTLGEVLEQTRKRNPQGIAIELNEERLTYEQLSMRVKRVAQRLQSYGLTSHDIVALLLQNTPASIIGFLALAWSGIGTIPLDPNIPPSELQTIKQQIPFVALMGERNNLNHIEQIAASRQFIDIASILANDKTQFSETEELGPTSDARSTFLYHFTSGSTGAPKAALHSQGNLVNGGALYQQTYQITSTDTLFIPIPLYHSFGMIGGFVTALLSGARVILNKRFVPSQIVNTIAQQQVSLLFATPMIYDLVARCALRETPDLKTLRYCLSSGSALSTETIEKFQARFGKPIYSVYGCTEVGIIASRWNSAHNWPLQALGRPLQGNCIRIVDEDGIDQPANTRGMLLVQTPAMFSGYYQHPEATWNVFSDNWYITGDIAYVDEQGFLYLVGRKDTFINVGGKKVNPTEVEGVLQAHPKVREAIVFGQNAGSAGEYVQAVLVLREPATTDEIAAFCRQRLATYKVPSHIQVVDEFAKTSLGKIRRSYYSNNAETPEDMKHSLVGHQIRR